MKAATWNVNSIRARVAHVCRWLEEHQPDVCCLQELKCMDDAFPHAAFEACGYHCYCFGQKARNGVALLSRTRLEDVQRGFGNGFDTESARLITARCADLAIINVYVPNGQAPATPAFEYKRDFLRELHALLRRRWSPDTPLLLAGDFNVAPTDDDVYNPAALRGSICFHPDEQNDFQRLLSWGLHDLFRTVHPHGKFFSWWDYRGGGFPLNEGMRLDHILVTESVASRCHDCFIDTMPRGWARPSDHAPVVAVWS